jgi:hypothetical protein
MSYKEITRRMDAIEKRQKDLERLVKGVKKAKAVTKKKVASPKKPAVKKAGEVVSPEVKEKGE